MFPLQLRLLPVAIACASLTAVADDTATPAADEDAWRSLFSRYSIYLQEPKIPEPLGFRTPADLERYRLKAIDQLQEKEISAPPLIVRRISSLAPKDIAGDETQAVFRAERKFLRERARSADRLYTQGQQAEAIQLMQRTEQTLQTVALRVLALNRLAVYYFRLHRFEETAFYARRAWELNPQDFASACNLAATLLTVGQVDEALNLLLRIYGKAFDRRDLAYSVHFNLACAYSLKNEPTKAIQNLALAAQFDPVATYAVLGDPQLDGIRDTAEYRRIQEVLAHFNRQVQQMPMR